jgi:hypothetical protein
MIVNFNDPASIFAWWQINPARHRPQIEAFAAIYPQFADSIKAAGDMARAGLLSLPVGSLSVSREARPAAKA